MDEEDKKHSMILSSVMDDIGMSKFIVDRRREMFLHSERMYTLIYRLNGRDNITQYCFGSQIEGTTTPGMASDIDMVYADTDPPVILSRHERNSDQAHLLIRKDSTSLPRHCCLEVLCPPNMQLSEKDIQHSSEDTQGRRILHNTVNDLDVFHMKHGPSRSNTEKIDVIYAYHCAQMPDECLEWKHRSRPGHWPTDKMIQEACKHGIFLLAAGHPESKQPEKEWRYGTNLQERHFMFQLNLVQLKTYVLLKMIKKDILNGDVTSFHCKTALLFTIEQQPASVWTDDNLLCCVKLCLHTIKGFLEDKSCPHYFIPGMNLFIGKLSAGEMETVKLKVDGLLENLLPGLLSISVDDVGARISAQLRQGSDGNKEFKSRKDIQCDIIIFGLMGDVETLKQLLFFRNARTNAIVRTANNWVAIQELSLQAEFLERYLTREDNDLLEAARAIRPVLYSYMASCKSAHCITEGLPISDNILNMYEKSMLNTDVTSSKLRLASMYYCKGDLDKVLSILDEVEQRCRDQNVVPLCNHFELPNGELDSTTKSRLLNMSGKEFIQKHTACCLCFIRAEAACVPPHLIYEMYRSTDDGRPHKNALVGIWMNMACVDALPFLYYLRFLTLHALGRGVGQLQEALNKLLSYVVKCARQGHEQINTNLIGHCWELLNDPDIALLGYKKSLSAFPRNNAARWHIVILLFRQYKLLQDRRR